MRFLSIISILFLALLSCNGSSSGDNNKEALEKRPSKYTGGFNDSINAIMNAYYDLTEKFVQWDSTAIPANANELKTRLEKIQLTKVKDPGDAVSDLEQARKYLEIMQGN